MTKGQMKFAAFVAWLVVSGGGIYMAFIYINPILVWIVGVMGCPAALLLILEKIEPSGFSDYDHETRSSKNDGGDDIFITPPPLAIGYGVWSVNDD